MADISEKLRAMDFLGKLDSRRYDGMLTCLVCVIVLVRTYRVHTQRLHLTLILQLPHGRGRAC
jgi:hypothetical protein